jgi:hypothetical protein
MARYGATTKHTNIVKTTTNLVRLRVLRDLRGYVQARLSTVFSNVAPGTVMFHLTVQR